MRRWILLLESVLLAAVCLADTPRVRLGDLEVAATAVQPAVAKIDGPLGRAARTGYFFVIVDMELGNVAAHPVCTDFEPRLETDAGDSYSPVTGVGLFWPQSFHLSPKARTVGKYIFEVKEGQRPVRLRLLRHVYNEALCTMVQGRSMFAPEQDNAVIDLTPLVPRDVLAASRRRSSSRMDFLLLTFPAGDNTITSGFDNQNVRPSGWQEHMRWGFNCHGSPWPHGPW